MWVGARQSGVTPAMQNGDVSDCLARIPATQTGEAMGETVLGIGKHSTPSRRPYSVSSIMTWRYGVAGASAGPYKHTGAYQI
jgi:hypothetical protein